MSNTAGSSQHRMDLVWIVICGLLVIAMSVLLGVIANPTALETGLLTFILAAASSVVSFLVSKIYAEKSFDQVMRDHGVQIARGLIELKNQMESLADWVAVKRNIMGASGRFDEPADMALEHVELTLQGFRGLADNAVGGIAGVIGDAYSQYEELINQLEGIRAEGLQKQTELEREMNSAPVSDIPKFRKKIDEVTSQTRKRISELAKDASIRVPIGPAKRTVTVPCPICERPNKIEIFDRPGETKPALCDHCGAHFNAHMSAQEVFARPIPRPDRGAPRAERADRWFDEQNIDQEARAILLRQKSFLRPERVDSVIESVVERSAGIETSVPRMTVYQLQAKILSDGSKTVSNEDVRVLFKVGTKHGGVVAKSPVTFYSEIQGAVSSDALKRGYVQGTLARLAVVRPVLHLHAPMLAKALFGENAASHEQLVASAISKLNQAS